MKLFTNDKDGKFVQFKEQEFKEENKEVDLEILLENNPEYFFDNSKILIIGSLVHDKTVKLLKISKIIC